MAGTYADVPGQRFALDADGSVAWQYLGALTNAPTDITSSLQALSDENELNGHQIDSDFDGPVETHWLVVAFPEARDVSGVFMDMPGTASYIDYIEASSDTTDGRDGTWTQIHAGDLFQGMNMQPDYRNKIEPLTQTGIKGLRFAFNSGSYNQNLTVYALHIYGTLPTAGIDRLAFWHPTLDQQLGGAWFDYGDIAQGAQQTKQFRLKNLSSSLTAQTISITGEDLHGTMGDGLTLSSDDTTYVNPLSVPDLTAGAMSSVLYARRTVGAAEATQLNSARFRATVGSWA